MFNISLFDLLDTFIPMKVPLDESYHSLLQPMEYFTPKMFIDTVTNLKVKCFDVNLFISITMFNLIETNWTLDRSIQHFKILR